MGRRKIEIKPITEERNRSVTFIKRKGGLFKKAHELAVLCQVELALVVITPDRKVHEYCTASNIEDVVHNSHKYPVVERKGLQDYSPRYSGDSRHDDDDDGPEKASLDDSDVDPEEMHAKNISRETQNLKLVHGRDEEHADRSASMSDSRSSARPRLKVQIPRIPPIDTPQPHGAQNHDGDVEGTAALGHPPPGAADAADPSSQQQQHQQQQHQQHLHMQQATVAQGDPTLTVPVVDVPAEQLSDADKVANTSRNQPQHPQVSFPSRLNSNRGPPQSPSGFLPQGYPPYVPYAGYFNNYPVGYGYPAPPSAYPGNSAKPTSGPHGVGNNGASAQIPPNAGANNPRGNGAPGPSASGSAGGGRWSAYPQSPMTYFVPAPMSGGESNQVKLEPGAISAAMPSRYMNEMLASPSNYFSMEWGVWDPQASAGPGGTARVSPSSMPTQSTGGVNGATGGGVGQSEIAMASPLQFVPTSNNERKRTVTEEAASKWRPKD